MPLTDVQLRQELEQDLSECRQQHGRDTRQEHRNLQYSATQSKGSFDANVASLGGELPPDTSTLLRMIDDLGSVGSRVVSPGLKLLLEAKAALQERRFAAYAALLLEAAEGYQVGFVSILFELRSTTA